MKKRYLVLTMLLAASITAAGCGSKKADDTTQDASVTVAPVEDTDTQTADDGSLVDMQKSDGSDIKNVIGDKTATASKVIIVNNTGSAIKGFYVRPTTDDDDDDWGNELINGLFTLADGDKALYYYEKDQKDADGNTVTSYDLRIVYTDEEKTDCYFRKLPLTTITQITLRMEGIDEDAIPYATYLTNGSKQEVSTLSEVKKRLGLDDSEEDSENTDDNQGGDSTNEPSQAEPTATPSQDTPEPTAAPSDNTDPSDAGADAAKQYIGQSYSSLVAALGDANGSDYVNEPETGETGYHYYDTFTVSTTVDESGNEVVAGVW